ncbi:FMN-binding negative transcriptional regulator [Streptomyces sp. 8P21H-1]|uniref:FMN-binding negative transcriptional regulator n=1 Tax=Streptomyces sp. 8P21H-1 TaxID=2737048 RepID=UPI00156E2BF0|nr:FMN-binding negative transcriptional regulator [Streptomyces sp. 8P21H-1]NSL43352.1 FMN-binding negative transcriptional regulator [Streptomyces sp. 8P21H-1]
MVVPPRDTVLDTAEWQTWIADGHDFGSLGVNSLPGQAPLAAPHHFSHDGDTLLLHFTRRDPDWEAVEAAPDVTFTVPALPLRCRRAMCGRPLAACGGTQHFTAAQFTCRTTITEDHDAGTKPTRRPAAADGSPCRRPGSALDGLRLDVIEARAKTADGDYESTDQRADPFHPRPALGLGPG